MKNKSAGGRKVNLLSANDSAAKLESQRKARHVQMKDRIFFIDFTTIVKLI